MGEAVTPPRARAALRHRLKMGRFPEPPASAPVRANEPASGRVYYCVLQQPC